MVRCRRIVSVAFAAFVSASTSYAQDLALLTPEYVKKLDPKAVEVYRQGADAYDHVNYELAMKRFYEAMQLDPNHVKLRFLVARLAHDRGRMLHGEDAVRLFNMAEEALTGLINRKNLQPEDLRRAEEDLKEVKREIEDVGKRDTRRKAIGRQIIEEVAKEREAPAPLKPLGVPQESGARIGAGGAASGGAYPPGGQVKKAGTVPSTQGGKITRAGGY